MSNQSRVKFADGREVCLSYGVPVAAFIPGRGYLRLDKAYSVTTSRHANSFAGSDAPKIPFVEFQALVSPLECK